MVWGYLSEFWESITDVVVGGTTYTIDFFEAIGNAVAGAVGSIFEGLTHLVFDWFYLLQWGFENLSPIVQAALSPLAWIFNFTTGFFVSAGSTLENLGIETPAFSLENTHIQEIFEAIPYFDTLMFGIAAIIGFLFVLYFVREIKRL